MRIFQALSKLEQEGGRGALCTIIGSQGSTPRHAGSKMLVYPDGRTLGTIGGGEMESRVISEALESLKTGKSLLLSYEMADPTRGDPGVCGGRLEVFVEPIAPAPMLIVAGGGHVGQAVAHLASWLGYRVVVTDDRPEFCTSEVVPDGDMFYPLPLQDLPEQVEITDDTVVVLCTRNVDVDVAGLPPFLDSPAAYIGVIGSRRRWETTRKQLIARGIAPEKVDRVVAPMGLEINAETPHEIAISILAEIIQRRKGGHGGAMSG